MGITCSACYGQGYRYYGDEEEFDVAVCEVCEGKCQVDDVYATQVSFE